MRIVAFHVMSDTGIRRRVGVFSLCFGPVQLLELPTRGTIFLVN